MGWAGRGRAQPCRKACLCVSKMSTKRHCIWCRLAYGPHTDRCVGGARAPQLQHLQATVEGHNCELNSATRWTCVITCVPHVPQRKLEMVESSLGSPHVQVCDKCAARSAVGTEWAGLGFQACHLAGRLAYILLGCPQSGIAFGAGWYMVPTLRVSGGVRALPLQHL